MTATFRVSIRTAFEPIESCFPERTGRSDEGRMLNESASASLSLGTALAAGLLPLPTWHASDVSRGPVHKSVRQRLSESRAD